LNKNPALPRYIGSSTTLINHMNYRAFPLLLSLIPSSIIAAEAKVEMGKFSVRPTLSATILPETCLPLSVDAEEWSSFAIEEILPHGSLVKKGDLLVRFDSENYDKKIRDAESAAAAGKLSLANAEADFASAEVYFPMQMQDAKLKHEVAREAWDHFQKIGRDSEVKEANIALRRAELSFDSEKEELNQLEKMYKADDLTENTEEIILELNKLAHRRTMEITLPRTATDLERAAKSADISLKENEQNIPRNLELKRIAMEDARISAKREIEGLEKLKADKDRFKITAPADGYFYYGSIEDGRWTTGDAVKGLVVHGAVMVKKTFAVIIPSTSKMTLESFVDEPTMRLIKQDLTGFASFSGRADVTFPAKIAEVANVPGTDGRYHVSMTAQYPAELPAIAGTSASVNITAYEKANAIIIPANALKSTLNGTWEVEVKKGEGTEKVTVTRGLTSGEKVEILSGLTKDQTIITP
jgi:multidrug efflux pump subunit AcrA (membrane-fusion protein)